MLVLRDWRAGELRVLAMALVVAVASITSVAFFADRVGRALVRDAHQLLGADLVLVSDHPWQAGVADEIARRGLQRAEATTFISMAIAGDNVAARGRQGGDGQLPAARQAAHRAGGRTRRTARRRPARRAARSGSTSGSSPSLAAPVGSKLKLGNATLEVAAILTLEPERGANFFNIAPRLFMNVADVPATGLVQTGSRVSYHLYAAGPREGVAALEAWARGALQRGQRVDNLESGRPEVRAVDRARAALPRPDRAARRDPRRRRDRARHAPLRRAPPRRLRGDALLRRDAGASCCALFGLEFVLLGVASCAAGALLGFARADRHRGDPRRAAARRPARAQRAAGGAGLPRRAGAAARLRAAAAGAAEERAGGARHPPRGGRRPQPARVAVYVAGTGRLSGAARLAGGRLAPRASRWSAASASPWRCSR